MSSLPETPSILPCSGPIGRRGFMRIGLTGFATLSWPGLLRLRAENATKSPKERTAVILVWLRGGCSHLDTYDPKPDIGSEYRGPFKTISSKVPGMQLTELIPLQAKIADKFTLVRSMTHTGGGHPAGSLQMLSGDPDSRDKPKPVLPDWMTVANYLRTKGGRKNPIPNYVGVNPIVNYDSFTIAGPAYVSPAYSPFAVLGDPSRPDFEVPNIGLSDPSKAARLSDRVALRRNLDTLERSLDDAGEMHALDEFEKQAMTLLTNPQTRNAFDLNKEDARTRDRYGRHRWGQQLLLARRLVESGVEIITSCLDGPQCGRVANWDDHAVNHHIFDALRFRMGPFDQAVSALIEDVYARGLDKRVLVVVSGEFGRTPKISHQPSSGGGQCSGPTGTVQPGRDHWPRAFTNLWAGGGIQTGGVVGASDARGEDVVERACSPGDFLSTIYRHLGIDSDKVTIKDFNGRPTPIVNNGRAIPELIG
ncbi:DUF1501 domain-containing protein [Chthoniobacter flavus]|nr:DUF1501 domain-containing protein [Chthoniobacter flavus]